MDQQEVSTLMYNLAFVVNLFRIFVVLYEQTYHTHLHIISLEYPHCLAVNHTHGSVNVHKYSNLHELIHYMTVNNTHGVLLFIEDCN